MKKFIPILLMVYIVSTLVFLFLEVKGIVKFAPSQKHYAVTITHDGFTPDELTIHKDDVIDFVNTDNAPHWPASNPHPIHDMYASFDPKRSVVPHETWSFEFNRIGEWHYHDHVIPYHTGVITVVQ
jgi:hypothetical protein